MISYVLRRLGQAVLTILGVMAFTFLLFRVGAGDIAAANVDPKAGERKKAEWRQKHGYDLPWVMNCHRRLTIEDKTDGPDPLQVRDPKGSNAANALALIIPVWGDDDGAAAQRSSRRLVGRYVLALAKDTPLEDLLGEQPLVDKPRPRPTSAPAASTQPAGAPTTQPPPPAPAHKPILIFRLSDGSELTVDLAGSATCGDLLQRINDAPGNAGRLEARISSWSPTDLIHSQFFHHLKNSVTFQSRSFKDNRKLTQIIAEHAPASLAITVPSLAIGWVLAMVISCYVSYYRGRLADKLGVFLCVLGMCIPFLAFMIYGQWLMFTFASRHAYGIFYRGNVYLPIAITVLAGLGGSVRFYRTVILDETHRDYVRTARAKGVPLPGILFRHVLKNCMLPILTNLILAIPFLIMGNLLVEQYFGIPGLGDLMLTSIQARNEPILSGLVFLTALVYTLGILLTDLSYALFDPRIRLR